MERGSSGGEKRLLGIEGMRAVAATSVLVYHVWLIGKVTPAQPHGVDFGSLSQLFWHLQSGVTLFFVLSGFLLYRPYVAAALRSQPAPSLHAYLTNRALRILPAYWTILLFTAIAFQRDLFRQPESLFANLFFAQIYVPSFVRTGIIPAWSLAVEVTFYLLLPVLGGLMIRRLVTLGASALVAAFAPALLLLLSGLLAKALYAAFDLGIVWETALPVRADWFSFGMTLAVVRVLWEDGRLRLPRRFGLATAVAIAALLSAAVVLRDRSVLSALDIQTPIAAACALTLGLVIFSSPRSPLVRFLTWRPVFALGVASYSVFLWHYPLIQWLDSEGVSLEGRAGFAANLALIAALTVLASTITYRFVERPALARKRSWYRAARAEALPAQAPPAETQPAPAGATSPS
jgi:peptidoglycan/LPS O-acetylase OafA/YrhL